MIVLEKLMLFNSDSSLSIAIVYKGTWIILKHQNRFLLPIRREGNIAKHVAVDVF
jgi:hypothetical protein